MVKHVETTIEQRVIRCKHCNGEDTYKVGKKNDIQYYRCNNCKRKFADNNAYPNMRYPKNYNINALTFYYNGMSCGKVAHTFNDMENIDIPKSTIWRWVVKYSEMVNDYVLSLKPYLSDVWIADETVVNIWGEQYWFWDIIDTNTRFLIASHLSKTRTIADAIKLFSMAKKRSKIRPSIIITDKLGVYHRAFNKVFYTRYIQERAMHLTSQGFRSRINTNLIERFHGTVKQRYKVMRNLKEPTSARIILDGFVTHYNFFLEHSYLDYLTPATISGIGDEIYNWGDLIELSMNNLKLITDESIDWKNEYNIMKVYE
jgi:transposase-like protein